MAWRYEIYYDRIAKIIPRLKTKQVERLCCGQPREGGILLCSYCSTRVPISRLKTVRVGQLYFGQLKVGRKRSCNYFLIKELTSRPKTVREEQLYCGQQRERGIDL